MRKERGEAARRRFFRQDTLTVARGLLGWTLTTRVRGVMTSGRIVEVEAYCGEDDPASHSAAGRTKRTEVMFWDGGYCYVYFIYGAHYCVNVVTEGEGSGTAVLIRALEPVAGIDAMRRRRGKKDLKSLTNGPGKLAEALAITPRMLGEDLCSSKLISLSPGSKISPSEIVVSTRIGITKARHQPWRFFIKGSEFVSRG